MLRRGRDTQVLIVHLPHFYHRCNSPIQWRVFGLVEGELENIKEILCQKPAQNC